MLKHVILLDKIRTKGPMLDLGLDHMYHGSNVGLCGEKIEKQCFSVDNAKECNASKLSQNIFNDSLFDLMGKFYS